MPINPRNYLLCQKLLVVFNHNNYKIEYFYKTFFNIEKTEKTILAAKFPNFLL